MYCPFCGNEISDDSTFCPMCGQSINSPDVNVRKEEKESKKATGTMHWVLVLITVVLLLVTMIWKMNFGSMRIQRQIIVKI